MASTDGVGADPLGTEGIRDRVLAAWAASPARFREDANTEEDFALGGYRDRVVIELAQNAADAAVRAGVPGHVHFVLADGVLTAFNTGAPIDAAAVESLSTLRASTKRTGGSAGRFGVGFTAVVAVTDTPSIQSNGVGVAWSGSRTRALVAEIPSLAGELAERRSHVPALRLPFPLDAPPPPPPFTTQVTLPLRDEAAFASLEAQLAETGAALLLALPALETVSILQNGQLRTIRAARLGPATLKITEAMAGAPAEHEASPAPADEVENPPKSSTWRTAEASGELSPELLADRPTEERARTAWQVRWAVREDGRSLLGRADHGPSVLHAPTPSAEPLDFPALLIATFPLATDRRHVAEGPLTDFLAERAAETYIELLKGCNGPELLDLVPGPAPAGALDASIRRAVLRALPDTPLLPTAADHLQNLTPLPTELPRAEDAPAWTIPAAASDTRGVPDASPHAQPGAGGVLDADSQAEPGGRSPAELGLSAFPDVELGARSVRVRGRDAVVVDGPGGLVEVLVDVVPGVLPAGWPARHAGLRGLGVRRMGLADVVDALAGVEREPAWWRGVYEALSGADAGELGALPVPLADGRVVRGPRGALVGRDLPEYGRLGVLGLRIVDPEAEHPLLTRLGAVEAGARQVLADPAVRAAVEGSYEAEEAEEIADAVLSLARGLNGRGEPWLAELALTGEDGELYPAGELMFADSPLRDVMGDDSPFGIVSSGLVEEYGVEALENVGVLRSFAVLRVEDPDLDELDLDGIEDFEVPHGHISEFAAVRDLELVEDWEAALPLLARPPLRQAVIEPLRLMNGVSVPSYTSWWLRRNEVLGSPRRARDADPLLEGLYDPAPAGLDREFAKALGVRTELDDVPPNELLARLADPSRKVSRAQLRALWSWLATADELTPPAEVRAVVNGSLEVVPAEDAIILDVPYALPLLADQPLILLPHTNADRLAHLLDVPLASEELQGEIAAAGEPEEVPEYVRDLFPDAPKTYINHDDLIVDGQSVPWWHDGVPHASTMEGLARALAWHMGRWDDRLLLAALLETPGNAAQLQAEADL